MVSCTKRRRLFERAAVLIAALVGQGREKLAQQRTVRNLQLDAIGLSLHGVARDERETLDNRLDIAQLHRFGYFARGNIGYG